MTDNTNDTYIAEDGLGTPALWLRTETGTDEHLLSKDGVRALVNSSKPAYWGAPSRDAHVDRLWAAIVATAGPAPEEPTS